MINKRTIMLYLIPIVLVLFFIIMHLLCYNVTVNPNGLFLDKVIVRDDYIIISGFNYGGLYNYQSYKAKYSNGVLYVKYKGGLELPWMEGTNSPDFYPILNKYNGVSKIYLSSTWKDDSRLIWTKENGAILRIN